MLRLLFLVQKTAPARGAVREPRAMVIVPCLSQGGHPFFEPFLRPFFYQQAPNMVPKWSQNHSKNTLLHNTRDLDFCCYLQHFVAIEPPKTTQKVLQNRIKKSTAFRTSKSHPRSSKKVPKRVSLFRGWAPWGASWGTFGAPICFLTRKVHPKGSKSDPKVPPGTET